MVTRNSQELNTFLKGDYPDNPYSAYINVKIITKNKA